MAFPEHTAYGIQLRGLLRGGLEPFPVHHINGLGVETEHVVPRKIRVDGNVQEREVIFPCVIGEKVHRLHEDIAKILDFFGRRIGAGKVYADNDVGAEFLDEIGGIVVAHAAVHENHAFRPHRDKEPRDGHGGAKGGVY